MPMHSSTVVPHPGPIDHNSKYDGEPSWNILLPLCETFRSQTVKLRTPIRAYLEIVLVQNLIQATIHQKMMKLPLFLVIIFILLSNFVESRIFESETINRSTCKGSLVFRQRNGKLLKISGDMNVTKIHVNSVSMQGCGCYHMFSGRYAKVRLIPFQWKTLTLLTFALW